MAKIKKHSQYYYNGNLQREYYLLNNKFHNPNGPADIYYYENGNKKIECYLLNNLSHNENGPSDIYYHNNGSILKKDYCLNNIILVDVHSDEELKRYIKLNNIK